MSGKKSKEALVFETILERFLTLAAMKLRSQLNVLIVCGHQGYYAFESAKLGHNVTVLEYSNENINYLRQEVKNYGFENQIDIRKLTNETLDEIKSFDVTVIFDGIEEIIARESHIGAKNILRQLGKKSEILFWEIPGNEMFSFYETFDFDDIIKTLTQEFFYTVPIASDSSHCINYSSNFYAYLFDELYSENEFEVVSPKKMSISNDPTIFLKLHSKFFKITTFQRQNFKILSSRTGNAIGVVASNSISYDTKRYYVANRKLITQIEESVFVLGENLFTINIKSTEKLESQFIQVVTEFYSEIIEHGDIRPWNFLWDGDTLYLVDFGSLDVSQIPIWAQLMLIYYCIKRGNFWHYDLEKLRKSLFMIASYSELINLLPGMVPIENFLGLIQTFDISNPEEFEESLAFLCNWLNNQIGDMS